MWNDFKTAVKITLLVVSYIGIGYICYVGGMKTMHKDLTDDMKRNNDAAIPAITKSGKFYLYTQDTTFAEWKQKQQHEESR